MPSINFICILIFWIVASIGILDKLQEGHQYAVQDPMEYYFEGRISM